MQKFKFKKNQDCLSRHSIKIGSPQISTGIGSLIEHQSSFQNRFSVVKFQTQQISQLFMDGEGCSSRNIQNCQLQCNKDCGYVGDGGYADSLNESDVQNKRKGMNSSMMLLQLSSLSRIFEQLKNLKYQNRFKHEVSQIQDFLLVIENNIMGGQSK